MAENQRQRAERLIRQRNRRRNRNGTNYTPINEAYDPQGNRRGSTRATTAGTNRQNQRRDARNRRRNIARRTATQTINIPGTRPNGTPGLPLPGSITVNTRRGRDDKPPKPRTTRPTSTTRPSSSGGGSRGGSSGGSRGGSGGSGGSGGGSGGSSGGGKPGKPGKPSAPTGPTPGNTDSTATIEPTVEQQVAELYNPAFRAIARQRDSLQQQQIARQKSQENFEAWLRQRHGEGAQWLQTMQANAQNTANQSQQDVANRINTTMQSIQGLMNGASPDALVQAGGAGAAANAAANAAITGAASAYGNATTTSNYANFNANQAVDAARLANLRSTIAAEYNRGLADLGNQETGLRTKYAEGVMTAKQQAVQNELDRQAADFMNSYRTEQLGLERDRLSLDTARAEVSAELEREKLRIQAEYNAGRLTLDQAKLMLRQKELEIKARTGARGKDNKAQQAAVDFLGKWTNTRLNGMKGSGLGATAPSFESLDSAQQGNLIHQAIAAIKARHPRLRQKQVWQILSGQFGGRLKVHYKNGKVVPADTPGAVLRVDHRFQRDVQSRFRA